MQYDKIQSYSSDRRRFKNISCKKDQGPFFWGLLLGRCSGAAGWLKDQWRTPAQSAHVQCTPPPSHVSPVSDEGYCERSGITVLQAMQTGHFWYLIPLTWDDLVERSNYWNCCLGLSLLEAKVWCLSNSDGDISASLGQPVFLRLNGCPNSCPWISKGKGQSLSGQGSVPAVFVHALRGGSPLFPAPLGLIAEDHPMWSRIQEENKNQI